MADVDNPVTGLPVIFLLILFFLIMTACVGSPAGSLPENHPPSGPGHDTALSPASVLITSPAFDAGIGAGNVTIMVGIRNFTLSRTAAPDVPGEGVLICFMDEVPPVEAGRPALTAPGTYQISLQPSCTWNNVRPGTHTFAVELVNNDLTPLVPPVLDAIDVTAVYPPGGG